MSNNGLALVALESATLGLTAPVTINGPSQYAHLGQSVSGAGDVNGDGIDDFLITAYLADAVNQGRGANYVIYGKAGGIGSIDLNNLAASQGFAILGPAGPGSGSGAYMVASAAGDLNHDGFDDILVGAPSYNNPRPSTGISYIVYGHATSGTINLGSMTATQGSTITETPQPGTDGGGLGTSVAGVGDVNGDGYDDVLIGAPNEAGYVGRAFLLFGTASGIGNMNLATMTASQGLKFDGNSAFALAGYSVAGLGDINRDGVADFAIGATSENSNAGKVYVYFGGAGLTSQTLGAATPAQGFTISGINQTGYTIAGAGDVNGDGYADLLISEGSGGSAGADYVIFGKAGGFGPINLAALSPSDGIKISWGTGGTPSYVAGAGDVDGDGFDDILVGGSRYGNGVVYLIPGQASLGPVDLSTFSGVALYNYEVGSGGGGNAFGWALARAGDINADGLSDVIVGNGRSDGGDYGNGRAYIYYGVEASSAVTRTGTVAGQSLVGGTGNDFLYGMGGNDALWGHAGNDLLDGGTGIDMMHGGTGDDSYIVDDPGDRVFENPGEGTDTIKSSVSYSLVDAPNVERLYLTGTANLNATGSNGNDFIQGNDGNNVISGGDGDDIIVSGGGVDTLSGGGGNDGFYMGAALDAGDVLDGGSGSLDQVGLQGDYSGGLTLGANSLTGIEQLVFLAGSDTRFGDPGTNLYSYVITTDDGNVAAGQQLVVQANALLAGESLTFNGSAETDGSFLVYAGLGSDHLTGGQQNDAFYFGVGRFGAGDSVDGQGGTMDQLGLQGDYSGANAVHFGSGQISNIEMIVLLSGADTRFNGGGSSFSYTLVMDDANATAGSLMTVQANTLRAGEVLTLDASAEHDASYRVYGGAGDDHITGGDLGDELWGNAGNDTLIGRGGADQLHGGAGNDTFVYQALTDSTLAAQDHIFDFAGGDTIDVAATGLFDFHSGGFTHSAGEVIATYTGSTWLIQGDSDGDGVADLSIQVDQASGYAWSAADFHLAPAPNALVLPIDSVTSNDMLVVSMDVLSGAPAPAGNDTDTFGLHHLMLDHVSQPGYDHIV